MRPKEEDEIDAEIKKKTKELAALQDKRNQKILPKGLHGRWGKGIPKNKKRKK